jgi:hypothetical protein
MSGGAHRRMDNKQQAGSWHENYLKRFDCLNQFNALTLAL